MIYNNDLLWYIEKIYQFNMLWHKKATCYIYIEKIYQFDISWYKKATYHDISKKYFNSINH